MPTMREILTQQTPKIVLSADVFFSAGKAYVTGYRVDGGIWVRFEYDERIEIPIDLLDRVFAKYGWKLAQTPVKQPGFRINYFLERNHDQVHSALEMNTEAKERRRFNEVVEQFRAFEEFKQQFTS